MSNLVLISEYSFCAKSSTFSLLLIAMIHASRSFEINYCSLQLSLPTISISLRMMLTFSSDMFLAQLTSNTGYLLLLRAFKWVHQPHSLASLQKHASEPWIQLFDFVLTRPSLATTDHVDTFTDACATRLLQLHSSCAIQLTYDIDCTYT